MTAMRITIKRPLLADCCLVLLHLNRKAGPMAAYQGSTDGPRPIAAVRDLLVNDGIAKVAAVGAGKIYFGTRLGSDVKTAIPIE